MSISHDTCGIKGLSIYYDSITDYRANLIKDDIYSRKWDTSINRRTQHYNYRYLYNRSNACVRARDNVASDGLYRLSESNELSRLCSLINSKLDLHNDQCIVNEYTSFTIIGKHVDNKKMFGNTVVAVSILAPTLMRFTSLITKESHDIVIPPNSTMVMKDDARYKYTHEIPLRKRFMYFGEMCAKTSDHLRISVTYREMIQ